MLYCLGPAFKDEQETVDFYLDLADQTQDQSIKKVFQRAAADEQNHAVWFLYLLIHSSTQQTRQVSRLSSVLILHGVGEHLR